MRRIRPNITMPEDQWKELQAHVEKLKKQSPAVISASSIICTLVREYLDKSKRKGGKQK
jgi:hypothetical protein